MPPVRGVAALAIAVCLVLFASLVYISDRASSPPAGPVAAFLPADGQAWFDQETVTDGSEQWHRLLAVENARLSGPAAVQSLDGALGSAVIESIGSDAVMNDHFWRSTSTLVDPEFTEQQTVRLYRAGPDVALVAESEAALGLLYEPPLVLLPDDPRPGHAWQSTGLTSIGLTYDASFTLTGADQDCVLSAGTIEYGIGGLDAALVREVGYTWCPGEGIVHTTETADGSDVVIQRTTHEPDPVEHLPTALTWSDPGSWHEHHVRSRTVHGALGESPITSSASVVPAARTRAGLIVRANRSNDVVALAPDDDHLTVAWWAHPGGQILRLATFGDITVATTAQRQIVAYSATGVRLWQADAGDLVMTQPVALDATTMVVVTISGEVLALDVRTGAERWRVQAGSDVGADPVVAGGTVLVGTRTGWVLALDGTDGSERWRTEMPSSLTLAAAGEVLVVAGYTSLTGLDLDDGTPLWTISLTGRVRSMAGTAESVVVATDDRTFAVDAAGNQRWSRGGATQVLTDGEHLAVLEDDGVALLTLAGQEVATHRIGALLLASYRQLLALPDGVGLVGDQWDVRMWRP